MKEASFPTCPATEAGFTFGNLRLQPDGTLLRGQAEVHLPPKELAALRLLLSRAGQIVTPAELKATLWADVHVTPDSISKCMSSLRARLEPEECIQTVYKRGYRLNEPVLRDEPASPARPLRLAIVPFATALHVPAYLGSGIAEEALGYLSNLESPAYAVLARDSIFTLAQRGFTAQQIGAMLGADLVLTGTVFASPLHYRLRVEMVRAVDGVQIWAEDMLVRKEDCTELQSELVERLAFRLAHGPALKTSGPAATHALVPASPAVYDLFLRGHQEWQTLERHRMQDGTQQLLRATELDASFTSAQLDLVRACITESLYGFVAPTVAADQVRHVTEVNPYLSEDVPAILPALGWLAFHVDHDRPAALRFFARSAELPDHPFTTRMRVLFALSQHQFEEARDLLEKAIQADPYAAWLHAEMAWTLHLAGNFPASLESLEHSLSSFPENEWVQLFGALILAFQGQAPRATALARALVQQRPYFDVASTAHAYALACEGRRAEAQSVLERLQWLGRERYVLGTFNPAVSLMLGDVEGAIAELHASERACCPWFFQMLADPRLKGLHGHPEFEQMRKGLLQREGVIEPSEEGHELSFSR